MFSKIDQLEKNLMKLAEALERPRKVTKYFANQVLRAENIHLDEGASLTINMNNMIFSTEIVSDCLETVRELKKYFPINGELGLTSCINYYEDAIMSKAIKKYNGNRNDIAKNLGLTDRQVRYRINKLKEVQNG